MDIVVVTQDGVLKVYRRGAVVTEVRLHRRQMLRLAASLVDALSAAECERFCCQCAGAAAEGDAAYEPSA